MALTTAQKLAAKKHLGYHPTESILDPFFAVIEDAGATQETELTTSISTCDTAKAAIKTAQDATDDLVEGGGAKFSYTGVVAARKQAYREEVENLARILGVPILDALDGHIRMGGLY
jgi:hypothetical protein